MKVLILSFLLLLVPFAGVHAMEIEKGVVENVVIQDAVISGTVFFNSQIDADGLQLFVSDTNMSEIFGRTFLSIAESGPGENQFSFDILKSAPKNLLINAWERVERVCSGWEEVCF